MYVMYVCTQLQLVATAMFLESVSVESTIPVLFVKLVSPISIPHTFIFSFPYTTL